MNAPLPQEAYSAPMITSKLPKVGTTIFTVMSALAAEHGAVNLGQGFPDFECDPNLIDQVSAAMRSGFNQYPPMAGIASLRQTVSRKISALYGHDYDPATEITITAGATQAILTALLCSVGPGDEVIVIEPAYDSYLPGITLAGATPILVSMTDQFRIDWERVEQAVSPRSRLIMINSPHNPSGLTLSASDMQQLQSIVLKHNLLVISDEVYEHMVFDGLAHQSACRYPELAQRSFVVTSFGKTFHVTGWKMAYCAAPAALSTEFRKVHQFNVFTVNTPMQHALDGYLADPARYLALPQFYQAKRDRFRRGLEKTRFKLFPCEGTFFQMVDYRAISDLPEADFAKWLTTEIGVAAIPLSAFFDTPVEHGVIRFCFAKRDETLDLALQRLGSL